MANKVDHFSEDLAIIQKLDDAPNDVGGLNAEQLKAKFDQGALALQKFLNEVLIPKHNKLCDDMENHIQTDPTSIRDNNVSLTAEVISALGLTGGNPTLKDALLALEQLARLEPETAKLMGLESGATQDEALAALWSYVRLNPATAAQIGLAEGASLDEAVRRLYSISVESDKAYVCIAAKYAATGNPAPGVAFSGPFSGRTGVNGTYFRTCSAGEHTFSFDAVIGSKPVGDVTVVAELGKVAFVNVVLEKADGLQTITESGSYLVAEDAGRTKVCAVGGGGAGGAYDVYGAGVVNYAISGGCGGRITEKELDLAAMAGGMIEIVVGAGGETGGNIGDNNNGKYGAPGGTTSVKNPSGAILLTASGGVGGEAQRVEGGTATIRHTVSYYYGVGVGATVMSMNGISFLDEDRADGLRVFGHSEGPLVGVGGAALGYAQKTYDKEFNRLASSAGNAGAGASGSGSGGAARIISSTGGTCLSGGSGAVYFMEVS